MSYGKKLWGAFLILGGSYFLIEHILVWDELAFFDFIGHEWLGFILVMAGILLNVNWSKKRFSWELKKLFKKK